MGYNLHDLLDGKFDLPPSYELEAITDFVENLARSDRFIDVGANQGIYSYIANKLMSGRDIIAIEANPALCKKLQTLFDSGNNKFIVHNNAASDEAGYVELNICDSDSACSSIARAPDYTSTKVVVQAVRLDDIVDPMVNSLVKIDVEGYEYRVVVGAKKILNSLGVIVYVEMHGWGDQTIGKYPWHVFLLFYNWGFGVDRMGETHIYRFSKQRVLNRTRGFIRYGLVMFVKYIIRVSGLRPVLYKIKSSFDWA